MAVEKVPSLPPSDPERWRILAQIYRGLDAQLREQLAGATIEAIRGAWSLRRSAALLEQVRAQLTAIAAHLDPTEAALLRQSLIAGQEYGDAQLVLVTREHGVTFQQGEAATWHTINTQAVEALAQDIANQRTAMFGTGGTYAGSVLRNVDDYLREIGKGTILKGVALGQGPRETGRQLREAATAALQQDIRLQDVARRLDRAVGVTYADDSVHSLQFYGQMAARTGHARAVNLGAENRYHEYGVELFQISTHGTLCYLCRPYEGTVWRFPWASSREARRYPLCPVGVPLHPNCLHVKAPYIVDAFGPGTVMPKDLRGADSKTLYAKMREEHPDLMHASRQGFAFENEWTQAIAANPGANPQDLRGSRWTLAGIEARRLEATRRMLENPSLSYVGAMAQVTNAARRAA